MEENKLFHDRYFLERLLGRGNFSEVWLAKDTKTDIQVALKIYAPATGLDDNGLNVFAREFALVVNANHKNLLKPIYYDSFERKPYLVLPYCKNGSIMKEVGKFTEKDAWRLFRDVASGLAWLHGMNPPVIHQDIKPDNIMIGENGDFMITDFGVSTHLKSTLRKSLSSAFSSAGTIAYMAPERFGKDNTPIMANDVYSLGATVFEMLTGDAPFGNDGGLVQKKGAEVPELKGDYSPALKKVMDRCLRLNPWERPTAEQLERYAEEGLNSGTVHMEGDKSFWSKYKWIILAGIVVIVAGLAGLCFYINNKTAELEQQEQIKVSKIYNDSINVMVNDCINKGDSLVKVGDKHEEGFEQSYVGAYQSYKSAIEEAKNFIDGKKLTNADDVKKKMSKLDGQLRTAYKSLKWRAELFTDEPDVALEFNNRAKQISSIININDSIKK